MNVKTTFGLLFIFAFSCVLQCEGQKKNPNKSLAILIQKDVVADTLENRVKDVPLVAVRVLTRYRLAAWLWEGNSSSVRAEQIAVRAVDDLYQNKAEVPSFDFSALGSKLFILLDRNSKDSADKLREKYKINQADQPGLLESLLAQKEGDKLATEAAIRSLASRPQVNPEIIFLLGRLRDRNSPEISRLLSAILGAEETGRIKSTASTMLSISDYFIEPDISTLLQRRFLKIILDKSKYAAQMPDGDADGFLHLLSKLLSDFSEKYPELFADASTVQVALKTKVSRQANENQERNERIRNSPDRINALVEEAERTDDKLVKNDLYMAAARLALNQKKFVLAVDIVQKTVDLDESVPFPKSFRTRSRDQFLGEIATAALASNDLDSADYAKKKVVSPLVVAEILGKLAQHYIEKNNPASARDSISEGITFASKAEITAQSILSHVNLTMTAQKIDPSRTIEMGEVIVKFINKMPEPNADDKPESEVYKQYVESVMTIDWKLLSALNELVKVNRNLLVDMSNHIDKKEIRIIVEYILLTDSVVSNNVTKAGGLVSLDSDRFRKDTRKAKSPLNLSGLF